MTNYEMIKQMSVEEMHEFLIKLNTRRTCFGSVLSLPERQGLSYNDEIKAWLNSEAKR